MNYHVKIYTGGMGYAPYGWNINYSLCANRLYYIYGGDASFIEGKYKHTFEKGKLYILPQNPTYRAIQNEDDPLLHLFFDFSIYPPFLKREHIKIDPESDVVIRNTLTILETLIKEKKTNEDCSILAESYFKSFISYLDQKIGLTSAGDERFLRIVEYINEHYKNPVTVKELALMANMEECYFIRSFKKAMNITPYQYLREYRLNIAASLLKSGLTVDETARQVGYESASSLLNAIRKKRQGIIK